MRVWRAQGRDPHLGTIQVWATSERNARILFRNDYGGMKPLSVEALEIPTTKAGLVEWLNRNFNTDNG